MYNVYGDEMKYNGFELSKIQTYEQKRGIKYAKADGKLYKQLAILCLLSWIYMNLMSLFYLLGRLMEITDSSGRFDNIFVTILTVTAIILMSAIIYPFVSKLIGLLINVVAIPVLAASFIRISLVSGSAGSSVSSITEYDPGVFGIKKMFFWRHGIPMFIVVAICIVMVIIIVRERIIMKKEYNAIMNNCYSSEIIAPDV